MQLYALKVFFLHLIVATVYLTAICYEFVIEKDPNPIGAGLKTMGMHLFASNDYINNHGNCVE